MNAVATLESSKIDSKTVEDFLFSSNTKLTETQKQLFIQIAVRNNLDPFKREVYAIPYGNNFNIVTGYQTYIERAELTGKLNGWEAKTDGDTATVTIYRKDWDKPFVWEIDRSDFDKGVGSWKNMPHFMLKKVAISQAFRLAFPSDLNGLPYTSDELEGSEPFNQESVKPKPAKKETDPPVPIEVVVVPPTPIQEPAPKRMSATQGKLILELRTALNLEETAVLNFITPIGQPLPDKRTITSDQADLIIAELNAMTADRKKDSEAAKGTKS